MRELVVNSYKDEGFVKALSSQVLEDKEARGFPFPPLNHSCTAPSAKALISCGFKVDEVEELVPSVNIDQHSRGLIALASLIDEVRSDFDFPARAIKNDAIIFCSSLYAHLYKPKNRILNDIYRSLTRGKRNFIKNALVRNKGFSNFQVELDDEELDPYKDPVVGPLLSERQLELSLFKEIVSIVAANQFAPAIRFPNSVMLHHDRLKNIASLIRSPSLSKAKNLRTLNKKLRSYSETIKKDVGGQLFMSAFESRSKLLAICDFPIEWVSLNGFPLMFTHEISRIFPTPGNMLGELALRSQRVMFPYVAITDILVIRSFDPNDPIKDHLSRAIDIYKESDSYKNINIEIVDVSTEKELIDALNAYSGLIIVFDCHGGHGGEEGIAWLHIGDEKLDVWSLANKCRIPPVIVLSACSTHPVDGSHASVASGFFRCGAMSVLGTYAPVNAVHAGQFVARLLYRISAFVPMLIEQGPVSWREVITGLLRMSYVTDILMGMRDNLGIIDEKQYTDIHVRANYLINSSSDNWQDDFIAIIDDLTELDQNGVMDVIKEHYQFVETMLYSQLGRPENIVIYKDDS